MTTKDWAPIQVHVPDRASMDHYINAAVDRMIKVAQRHQKHGILITRLEDDHFTVELSDAVPFGYTEQMDYRNKTR